MASDSDTEMVSVAERNLLVDRAVLKVLGGGVEVVSNKKSGFSRWSSSSKLTVQGTDGKLHEYFLKIVEGDLGELRVRGEHTCMLELFKTMPSIVPTPRGFGKCLDTRAHFYFCDYLDIEPGEPNAAKLGEVVAELHRTSKSPTGKFGFHVVPFDGKLPLVAEWDSSWVSFFGKLLRGVHELDTQVNGSWEELDVLMKIALEKIVPRLLGPLEEDGRSVKPCLIHGDLWEGNIGTDPRTGDMFIFDSCAYYAHHEMELGIWRAKHHNMNREQYRDAYFKNFPKDEPVEECDDRNRLYSTVTKIMYSAHQLGIEVRAQAVEDLSYLIDRYSKDKV